MKHNIGLTGIVGSGKSLAASYFSQLGVNVIDTDKIAHQITQANGVAIPEIEAVFGRELIDELGAVNRGKMRHLVFNDKTSRLKLEQILHPIIFDEVLCAIEQSNTLYNILVVPLLFKADKYLKIIRRSIFIDCEEDTLIKRVVKRSNLSELEVIKIINTQLPRDMQMSLADDILDNNADEEHLFRQIKQLDEKYKNLFDYKI